MHIFNHHHHGASGKPGVQHHPSGHREAPIAHHGPKTRPRHWPKHAPRPLAGPAKGASQ